MKITTPLLLDGGLSNVLEAQGCDLNHPLWTAKLLATDPKAILQAHLRYLEAGARCIITSSYQATIPGFMALGYDRTAAETLLLQTVTLAEQAVERFLAQHHPSYRPLIAASIGPYGAYLADGSEYRGDYAITLSALRDFHRERIQLLDHTPADLFACETIPSFLEARVLADLLAGATKPAWISFSCRDDRRLNDGTPIEEAVALFADHPRVFAVGVNCTAPRHISGLIRRIRSVAGGKQIVVYPNSGEAYHAATRTWHGTSDPRHFAEMTEEWLALGAGLIGGCCRIGPEHIRMAAEGLFRPKAADDRQDGE